MKPLDLHVLSLPPAFNLSHDQTLQFNVTCQATLLSDPTFYYLAHLSLAICHLRHHYFNHYLK
jgi:hypothetical protein